MQNPISTELEELYFRFEENLVQFQNYTPKLLRAFLTYRDLLGTSGLQLRLHFFIFLFFFFFLSKQKD